jgi:type VI secretion system secreted protein VgrG
MPTSRIRFEINGCSAELHVLRFSGHEGISELFHFEVTVAADDATLAPADLVGLPAHLEIDGEDGSTRHVHGMVSRFEFGDAGKKLSLYHVVVVPKVWRLHHRQDCRVFQQLSTPEIAQKVLEGAGLSAGDDFRLSLRGAYKKREYCIQYRETDFAFVSRLLEEEGIHYFFEHQADKHVLVLADEPSAHSDIAGDASVKFRAPLGAMAHGEHVSRFRFSAEVRPGKYTVRDYDFTRPDFVLQGEHEREKDKDLAIYDYPGVHGVPAGDGTAIAKLRLEERAALREVGEGESACARLASGSTFTLAEHSREALNKSYLVVRVEHRGSEPSMTDLGGHDEARYENRFECVDASVPFHPPLVTPRPTIKGLQSAVVVGPAGEEIHTDAHGRVMVQFHWDRLGKKDDKASCWVRVSQILAGKSWGAVFLPRVGHEVLVDFLDGDPDRPLVVGSVYHGTNVPPYSLPSEKTKSTIKSNTSPDGGGFNELRFEDKKGSEELYLHAQKDMLTEVVNDEVRKVGHDETVTIENDLTHTTKHDRKRAVEHDEAIAIKNDRTKKVDHDEIVTIGNDRAEEIGNDLTEKVQRNLTLAVGGTSSSEVKGAASAAYKDKLDVTVAKDVTLTADGDLTFTIKGASTEEATGAKKIKSNDSVTIECGAAKVILSPDGTIKIDGLIVKVTASTELTVQSEGTATLHGSAMATVEANGILQLKGAIVKVG